MTTIYDDQRLDSGVFDFVEPLSREDKKARRKQQRQIRRQLRRNADDESQHLGDFPVRRWGYGSPTRKNAGRAIGNIKVKGIRTTTHTAATAYPYVSGPALGAAGIYMGEDRNGGGGFAVAAWALYAQGIRSGIAAVMFGHIGADNSSTGKAFA